MRGRAFLVLAHRWAGLTIAGFLIIAGVTGAALPFREELSWLCAPTLWRAEPPTASARPLPGAELAERVAAATGARPVQVPLNIDGRHAVSMFIFAKLGAPPLDYDQVVVDPYSGAIRQKLQYGIVEALPRDLPTFLLALHYGYIAGPWGQLVFGLAALVWLLDGIVGILLTFPIRATIRRAETHAYQRKPWLKRWLPAWRIRRHARGHRLTFDLHRAGGLWLWIVSTVFAWSAFGMNVPAFRDGMAHLAGTTPAYDPAHVAEPVDGPDLGYTNAARRGEELMAHEGTAGGFRVLAPERLDFSLVSGAYRYTSRTSLDFTDSGATSIWLDGASGRKLAFEPPPNGGWLAPLNAWADALHEADIWGLPYRIAVSLFGLLVTVLSVTGVMIWSKKRIARLRQAK